jgi:hypothetical protein
VRAPFCISPKNVRFFKANVRFIKQFTLVCAGETLKNLGQQLSTLLSTKPKTTCHAPNHTLLPFCLIP